MSTHKSFCFIAFATNSRNSDSLKMLLCLRLVFYSTRFQFSSLILFPPNILLISYIDNVLFLSTSNYANSIFNFSTVNTCVLS